MRAVYLLVALSFGGCLAGCATSSDIPAYARVSDPGFQKKAPFPKRQGKALVHKIATNRDSADETSKAVGLPSHDEREPPAFTPEWWALESRLDERVRKAMMICRGCFAVDREISVTGAIAR